MMAEEPLISPSNIGPHPALRGPTLETIRNKIGSEIPYFSVVSREYDGLAPLSAALVFAWTHLGSSSVNFDGYSLVFDESHSQKNAAPFPDLPTSPWDHMVIL